MHAGARVLARTYMCLICAARANLRRVVAPKILEYMAVGLRRPSRYEGLLSKSSVHERISLTAKRRISALAIDAQDVRTTAEDNDVLDFVNVMLPKVTNIGRFQCLS